MKRSIRSTLSKIACYFGAAALIGPVWSSEAPRIERDLVYAEYGSERVAGDLYLPPARDVKHPVVIMLHGGGWSGGERSDMDRFAEKLVEAGFAVFNISYRLAPDHRFPAQLEDPKRAMLWLERNADQYRLDPDNIGAWGYSAGAHLALLMGTVDQPVQGLTSKVKAVVAGAPPTDLRLYPDSKHVKRLMPDSPDEELFRLASPVANVDPGDAPAFMYHSKRDRIVWIENSEIMARALRAAQVDHQLFETSLGHYLGFFFSQGALDAGIAFLKQHLKDTSSTSS